MYTNAHIPFKNPNLKKFQPKYLLIRAVASGGAGGALAPLVFGRTGPQPGEQIMPTTVLRAPPAPGFSDLATALQLLESRRQIGI